MRLTLRPPGMDPDVCIIVMILVRYYLTVLGDYLSVVFHSKDGLKSEID